jgi:uncharacterized membrane protein YjgN (DUF898 family)
MDMQTAPAVNPAPPVESFRLKFSGDGGVYFGVWIVNLLLMIVTLGLFTPFARRRTVKYFYAHTVIAGSPLEFTGGIKRMFLGFLLFFGLYLAYSIASHTEQNAAAGLLAVGWVALTPWLWASAMRFRSINTRWRGIRGNFNASWKEAYAASWPLLVLLLTGAGVGVAVALARGAKPPVALAVAGGVLAWLLILLLGIRLEFNYARLRMQRSDFGGQPGRWKASFGDFVRFSAAALGVFLGTVLVLGGLLVAVVALTTGVGYALLTGTAGARGGAAFVFLVMVIVIGAFFVFYLSLGPALAYREARKFALIWNTAGLGGVARFRCDLSPWRFVRLRIKNMLLTLVTAGFWRPFAVTNEYRMKLESVTLHVKGGLDQLVGQLSRQQGAFADAIADAVGFDMVG